MSAFQSITSSNGVIDAPDDDDEHIARARAALPPHAEVKANHIEQIGFVRMGTHDAKLKEITKLTARKNFLETRAAQAAHERDRTGIDYRAEDVKSRIDAPRKEAGQIKERIKKLRDSTNAAPTITLAVVLHPIKPNRNYVDARITVKSADPTAALKKSREKIAATKKKRKLVKERSRYTLEEADARLVADVERKARFGEVKFGGCLARVIDATGRETQEGVRWPVAFSGSGYTIHDGAAMVAFLFKDRIIEVGRERLQQLYKPELAFTNAGRKAKLAELDAEILAEERREEALVELCEAAGIEVLRRPDANPFAVLGVALAPADAFDGGNDDNDDVAEATDVTADDDAFDGDNNDEDASELPDTSDDLDFG